MITNNTQTTAYPLDMLRLNIDGIISDKLFRGELWKLVNKEFEKKGLDYRSLQLLLDDTKMTASSLDDYELIAIAKCAFKVLKRKALDPKRYFSDMTLVNYESYFNVSQDEKLTQILFKNFKKINATDYKGEITYKELYDYLGNRLFIYDHTSQRSPKYRKVGSVNGEEKKIKVINFDEDAVNSIRDSIIEGKFEDSEIILNCEIMKGKKQKFRFLPKYEDILGDIIIEPNYVVEDEDCTWVSVIDGWHRCLGITRALSKVHSETGKWLDGIVSIRLVLATKERAKRIVHQTFQRSQDKLEWVNALEENDYTKFVDNLVSSSKYLTIENTTEEAINNDKLTSKSLLADTIKETDIIVNDLSESIFKSESIAKNFDVVYEILTKKGFDFNPQFVAGFIYLSYVINDSVSELVKFANKLIDTKSFISICKKGGNAKNIIEVIKKTIRSGE